MHASGFTLLDLSGCYHVLILNAAESRIQCVAYVLQTGVTNGALVSC